jgi:hypothetical protein
MKKLICIAMVLTAACVGTDNDGSRRTLDAAGYSNIELTGYKWYGCGQDDSYHTAFSATNPAGKRVSGVVCCGMMKGCTIRF